MDTRDNIEHYLIQMEYPFEAVETNMWVIRNTVNVVVTYESPLVIFRMKLMEVPKGRREDFFKFLLELNSSKKL